MKKILCCVLLFVATIQIIKAQGVEANVLEKYEPHVFLEMSYRLMKPVGFDKNKKYPLILSLHGAGGKGLDNIKQLRRWNEYLAKDEIREAYPCYVLAPQANNLWNNEDLSKIKLIIKDLESINMSRIYVLGHSMGGHGTYKFIQFDTNYFAAAAPSAGSGLATTEPFVDVSKIKHIPIWAFHGDKDPKCPFEKDLEIFNNMKKIGGNMKFTNWVGDKHGGPVALKMVTGANNGITQVSSDLCDKEPIFLKWLFNQKKK